MRTLLLLLALSLSIRAAMAGGYAAADFPSYAALPSKAKPWFQHLAAGQQDYSEAALLAKVPQAGAAIVELMQKITSDPAGSPEHLRLVIQAVHLRHGLSAAQQGWLRELLLSRLSHANGPVDEILKTEGLLLLETPASPENEALLVQYLSDTSAPFSSPRVDAHAAFWAMSALKRTGTLRSLRPLLKFGESHLSAPTEAGRNLYYYAIEAIQQIEGRAAPMSPALSKALEDAFPWCIPDLPSMKRAEKALATRPEFKPQLFALLQIQYFDIPKWGGRADTTALSALSLRSDLTPAEQKFITTELETHVSPEDESSFIHPAIRLLAHYPSPEHEALVVRFLNPKAKSEQILATVFRTLSIIGGERSLASMREVHASLKAKHATSFLQDLEQHIINMQIWLDRRTPPAQRHD